MPLIMRPTWAPDQPCHDGIGLDDRRDATQRLRIARFRFAGRAVRAIRRVDTQASREPADSMGMRRISERSSWRWLAALSALSGLLVLLGIAARGEASLGAAVPASTMCVGGLLLFLRMSVNDEGWERIVHGPTARRFLAVLVVISALIGLATVLILLGLALREAA